MTQTDKFALGDEVYIFDDNRRRYDENRRKIYRAHFVRRAITDETKLSWIVDGKKYQKKNPVGLFTEQMVEDEIWKNQHRYRLVEFIHNCPADKLKEVAKIVGYEVENDTDR